MKIGLLLGSFNPIHNGHLAIAEYFINHTDLDEIWFVVSPKNPFKNDFVFIGEHERFTMVSLAIKDYPKFKACNIEFSMPRPSYTINTINELEKSHPENQFTIIIGADNLDNFDRWKDYEQILEKCNIFVYDRFNYQSKKLLSSPKIKRFATPLIDISSTAIRERIKNMEDISHLIPKTVAEYLKSINIFYT